MKSHKALFLGVSITILVLVAAWTLYWYYLRSPQLSLTLSPAQAVVKVDSASGHAKQSISVGSHTIEVSADGFVPYKKTVTLDRTQVLNLSVLLKPIPTPLILSNNVEDHPSFVHRTEVFFLGNGGKTLYRTLSTAGQTNLHIDPMTPDTLSDINKVVWKPDGSVAMLKRSDGVYLYDFMRYDLLHQTNTLWGTNIDDMVWDPSGNQLAYTYYGANNEQSLKFADIQNKNVSIVANLAKENIDHPTLSWSPDGQAILLISNSAQKKTNYLYSMDVVTKKITQVTDTGEVSGAKWSPDSKHIAYIAPGHNQSGANVALVWVAEADGSGITPLNAAASDSTKVTWNNDSASLVVAETVAGANDQLVKIALSGTMTPYAYTTSEAFHPQNLTTVPDNDRVLFFNGGTFMSLPLVLTEYK